MIWLVLALLAALAMLPLAVSISRATRARGRREAALALHGAQLAELDRDLADAQIGAVEHASAMLEIQRRLLAVADAPAEMPEGAAKAPLLTALVVVPVIAFALYLPGGSPSMPSVRRDVLVAQAEPGPGQVDASIVQLRARLATVDPKSDAARVDEMELGKAEASRGNMAAAAVSWGKALEVHYDPTLAVVTAEALTEAAGHVTAASATLFRRALADAPAKASWRSMVQRRLREAQDGNE